MGKIKRWPVKNRRERNLKNREMNINHDIIPVEVAQFLSLAFGQLAGLHRDSMLKNAKD